MYYLNVHESYIIIIIIIIIIKLFQDYIMNWRINTDQITITSMSILVFVYWSI